MSGRLAVRVRPMGDRALLAELGSLEEVLALSAELRRNPAPGQVDAIPAARTVLVRLGPDARLAAAARYLSELETGGRVAPDSRRHEVQVVYDGADLSEVAGLLGISEDAVIARHTSSTWRVAFTGFAPGFAYLVAGDADLRVPRRASPRTSVPAGSVGLAGEFSGVYPRESPGGWQLIGRTDAILWDASRAHPALLAPGDSVVFRQVRELAVAAPPAPTPATTALTGGLTVLDPGFAATVQDRGRIGFGSLGVPSSGAADRESYAAGNEAVGNRPGAAAIEVTLGGLRIRAARELVVAVTGAGAPVSTGDTFGRRRERVLDRPFALHPGDVLELGIAASGLRSYVAVRGGIDVPMQLGSRSTDTLSRLGPAPLSAGDVLPIGEDTASAVALPSDEPARAWASMVTLHVAAGPRDDWFSQESLRLLWEQTWTVGTRSDRVGLRLSGAAPLMRSRSGELLSEGMVAGALQVPPDGQPVLFLADHPVTGGYPVVGVVLSDDLALAAQLLPGARIRFVREELPSDES